MDESNIGVVLVLGDEKIDWKHDFSIDFNNNDLQAFIAFGEQALKGVGERLLVLVRLH